MNPDLTKLEQQFHAAREMHEARVSDADDAFEDCVRKFSRELRTCREQEGIPLRALAKRMGISAPYLSDLERGRRPWNEAVLTKFVEAIKSFPHDTR